MKCHASDAPTETVTESCAGEEHRERGRPSRLAGQRASPSVLLLRGKVTLLLLRRWKHKRGSKSRGRITLDTYSFPGTLDNPKCKLVQDS